MLSMRLKIRSFAVRLLFAIFFLAGMALSPPASAAEAPGAEEIATVLGNPDAQPAGDNAWVIDGQTVTTPQLLTTLLPEREARLQSIKATIEQRVAASDAASSTGAIEAKRAICQKIAPDTIPRTKCYQELAMLRDAASQSNQSATEERRDAEDQLAKLDQDLAAIEAFKAKYGGGPAVGSPMGLGSMPFN
jgi:hypothetical protein